MPGTHVHPASLPDAQLLGQCEMRRLRRSGPGGQHRNKVETAVQLLHRPTGVSSEANERRSQAENRRVALFRLRMNLAIDVRGASVESHPSPLWKSRCGGQGRIAVNADHDDFPTLLAEAMDVVALSGYEPSCAAERLGVTPSQLIKLLKKEPRAIQKVNDHRREHGLHPLH